jgi:hypothetical protein
MIRAAWDNEEERTNGGSVVSLDFHSEVREAMGSGANFE